VLTSEEKKDLIEFLEALSSPSTATARASAAH
jgi:hypothetical protein